MGNIPLSKLAIYTYGFNIKKGGEQYLYTRISEVYHPDYLSLYDLKHIYVDADNYLETNSFIIQTLNQVKREMKTIEYEHSKKELSDD